MLVVARLPSFPSPLESTPLLLPPGSSTTPPVALLVAARLASFPSLLVSTALGRAPPPVAPLPLMVSRPVTRLVNSPMTSTLLATLQPLANTRTGSTVDNTQVSSHLGSTPANRAEKPRRKGLVNFTMSMPALRIPMVS